jgi:hypothetical protein
VRSSSLGVEECTTGVARHACVRGWSSLAFATRRLTGGGSLCIRTTRRRDPSANATGVGGGGVGVVDVRV